MSVKSRRVNEHMFSIELNSKKHVKNLSLANDDRNNVLIEGFLGKLIDLNFTEGLMLEINGSNGCLRMDLTEKEMAKLLPKKKIILKRKENKNEKNQRLI